MSKNRQDFLQGIPEKFSERDLMAVSLTSGCFRSSRENVSILFASPALHIPPGQSIENYLRDNQKKLMDPTQYLEAETKNSCSYNPGVIR